MIISDSLDKLPFPAGADAVLTLGCFDGFHVGHRLIARRLDAAGAGRALRGLLTFDPHPVRALQGVSGPLLIDTRREKEELLMEQPLDFAVFFPFTPDFAAMSAERFIHKCLTGRFRPRKIVVGPDTSFGRRRSGSVELLKSEGEKLGFEVDVVEKVEVRGEPVSSTRIRELIAAGDVERAEEFLGRPYRMTGEVVTGDGRSCTNGFPPTANLEIEEDKLPPLDGVYAVKVLLCDEDCRAPTPSRAECCEEGCSVPAPVGSAARVEYAGAVNVGFRPTVGGKRRLVEAHIIGFSGDLYGKRIALDFKRFIRSEERFSSLDELKKQIDKDIEVAEKMINM